MTFPILYRGMDRAALDAGPKAVMRRLRGVAPGECLCPPNQQRSASIVAGRAARSIPPTRAQRAGGGEPRGRHAVSLMPGLEVHPAPAAVRPPASESATICKPFFAGAA